MEQVDSQEDREQLDLMAGQAPWVSLALRVPKVQLGIWVAPVPRGRRGHLAPLEPLDSKDLVVMWDRWVSQV